MRYTPNLAAFARESVVFLRHQTETDQSGPAYASLLAGRRPTGTASTAIRRASATSSTSWRRPSRIGATRRTSGAATRWRRPSSTTARASSPTTCHQRRPGVADLYALTANDSDFAAVLSRLRRDRSARAFVQVAFTVTHGPYAPVDPRAAADFRREHPEEWPALPDEEVERWSRLYAQDYLRWQWDFEAMARERGLSPAERARFAQVVGLCYKVNVRILDHCFGRLVDSVRAAGLLEESLIAFTADHGETLDRRSALFKWTHGAEISPESIEVPLVVRLPGKRPRAAVYEGVSRSIDVYPTLAGLSGIAAGASRGVDGVDLTSAVLGRTPPPSLRSFSHTTLLGPELVEQFRGWLVSRYHPSTDAEHMWVSVRDKDQYARLRKLEDGQWGFDLFDLARRPIEAPTPLDTTTRPHQELARELQGYKARLLARYAEGGAARTVHEAEARERLRALGYIQ